MGLIQDGSVLITDGVIVRVGPTRQVENVAAARTAKEINANGRVVMPAFIDAHTRIVTAPARVTGLQNRVEWVRNSSPSKLEADARRYVETAIRHGTLTLETKSGAGLNAASEMKVLRVLAKIADSGLSLIPTFCGAPAIAPEFGDPAAYLSALCDEMLPKLRDRKLARYVEGQCDSEAFTAEQIRPYLTAAARTGWPLKLHGDQRSRSGCTSLAVEFGAVSVAGLNRCDRDDINLLARSATVAMLLPRMCDHSPPGRQLLDAGAVVAIASGFHPSTPSTLNMQTVVALACETMSFTPEEAICAATVNAAQAVGKGGACGTLECGREADLLILNASDYRDIALHFGCNLVHLAMRRGETVWQEGPLTCASS